MITEEQLKIRKSGIGASEASAVLGLSQWKTPVDVWLEKTGRVNDEFNSEPAYWGNVLEENVAQEYAKRMGVKVRRNNKTLRHKEHNFIICHLDRVVTGSNKIIECKTASVYKSDEWGEQFTDEIPVPYIIQVQHQMSITGALEADIPVLLGGQQFRIYSVKRDDELIKKIVDSEVEFWNFVKNDTQPPPIKASDIAALYPNDNGESVIANTDVIESWYAAQEINKQISELKKRKEEIDNNLKLAIGECSSITDASGKILATYKTQERKVFNKKLLEEHHPGYTKQFTDISTSRVLRVKK